jgi:hypothetical protein
MKRPRNFYDDVTDSVVCMPPPKRRKLNTQDIELFYGNKESGNGHMRIGIKINIVTKECKIGWDEIWTGMSEENIGCIKGTLDRVKDGIYTLIAETGEIINLDTTKHGSYSPETYIGGLFHSKKRVFF